ncbi:tetratricopeptide repeat protein [uncultured Paracoccus sp.]|uniref:tetratricopeptide repeat protein n=1 Tax=uncultured Paracoccus sp. TaxID=189685 RepID=UPI0030DDC454
MVIASVVPIAAACQGLDDAFARLAQPEGEGWRIAESDILREWSRSGSPAMDLLLQRGEAALDMGDIPSAIGHLTALTDHAPDFAAGFQTRAAAYATAGQFGPALADLRRTLELEPRHFAALTQLGAMLEEMGDDARALAAYRASLAIHPHQQEAIDGQARLEHKRIGTDI